MIRHEHQIEIRRPVSDVFTFISDLENIPQWQSEVVTSRVITPGPPRVGTAFEEDIRLFGRTFKTLCKLTEYQPTKRLSFRSESNAPVEYTSSFSFEPNGRGTKLTFHVEAMVKGFWKLFEPVARLEINNGIKAELKALQSILEQQS